MAMALTVIVRPAICIAIVKISAQRQIWLTESNKFCETRSARAFRLPDMRPYRR